MQKTEYNDDVDMDFSANGNWHHDIWLPLDAQLTEIHMRVYSFAFPDFIYNITWKAIQQKGNRLQIPVNAAKIGHSDKTEAVRLAFDITYYSDL
jgi:hypothetical protein